MLAEMRRLRWRKQFQRFFKTVPLLTYLRKCRPNSVKNRSGEKFQEILKSVFTKRKGTFSRD